MATIDIEQIDLAELAAVLGSHQTELAEDLVGRGVMRDIVAAHLGCSLLEAEQLVDTLVSQGFARLEHDPEGREGWRVRVPT